MEEVKRHNKYINIDDIVCFNIFGSTTDEMYVNGVHDCDIASVNMPSLDGKYLTL